MVDFFIILCQEWFINTFPALNFLYNEYKIKAGGAAMENNLLVNIGEQRFDRLMEQGRFYVDKTGFIKEWWETGSTVTLITRPRRFGKTLNMSMLECFFSNKYAGRSDLFEGLSIWAEEKYRELQGAFPVIYLTFANVRAMNYMDMEYKLTKVIADLFEQNRYLLKGDLLSSNEREYYEGIKPGMEARVASDAVHSMANFMQRYYGKDVIILLDEYDTPMQEAWLNGYWDEAVFFLGDFFNSTFKTNRYLCRGMITGITRISKESIFSDLNNLDVITATSNEYAEAFGFTEEEVFKALDAAGLGGEKGRVKEWYDGFNFGPYTDIYNPWSIASFIRKKGKYEAYWVNTGGNGLVNSLVQRGSAGIKQTMEELLQGKSFRAEIDGQIVFQQLEEDENAVWSLLLAAGYLKAAGTEPTGCGNGTEPAGDVWYTLRLTNYEVQQMFRRMVKRWFNGSTKVPYNNFIRALLINDVDAMNEFMNTIALRSFSSFDMAGGVSGDDAPERFYHGFVLGMVVELSGRYEIISNRESGFGRYDVMLKPADRERDYAYIIEFKVFRGYREKTLEETLANAHAQIEEKQYEAGLIAEGVPSGRIRKYGFVFQGKRCLIG